jgi:hypothetical protein
MNRTVVRLDEGERVGIARSLEHAISSPLEDSTDEQTDAVVVFDEEDGFRRFYFHG